MLKILRNIKKVIKVNKLKSKLEGGGDKMDKTIKFLLGLIAVALIGINVQMWNGKTGLIKPVKAAQGDLVYNVCYKGEEFGRDSRFPRLQMEDHWGFCQ